MEKRIQSSVPVTYQVTMEEEKVKSDAIPVLQFALRHVMSNSEFNNLVLSRWYASRQVDYVAIAPLIENNKDSSEAQRMQQLLTSFNNEIPGLFLKFLTDIINLEECPNKSKQCREIIEREFPGSVIMIDYQAAQHDTKKEELVTDVKKKGTLNSLQLNENRQQASSLHTTVEISQDEKDSHENQSELCLLGADAGRPRNLGTGNGPREKRISSVMDVLSRIFVIVIFLLVFLLVSTFVFLVFANGLRATKYSDISVGKGNNSDMNGQDFIHPSTTPKVNDIILLPRILDNGHIKYTFGRKNVTRRHKADQQMYNVHR